MPFTTRIPVRFADVDPAGLVYFPVLLHYCHVAMEEFFAARCQITYAELLTRERLGFPTVNVQAEFFAPFIYGDTVAVEVVVPQTGRTSATFSYTLRRAADALLCARATLVQVALNLDTRRAVELPARYRQAFAASNR